MSSSSPLVSIVVPSFVATSAQAKLLVETLDTVAAQPRRDHEVIVVDDGSPLDVATLLGSGPRTTVLRQGNAGAAAARNNGIAHSRGAYLVFLDADDHLLPPALDAGLE